MSRPEDEVITVAKQIIDNFDDEYFRRSIAALLVQL